jgi:hypothetical protein
MSQNPTSATGWPRLKSRPTPVQLSTDPFPQHVPAPSAGTLWTADRRLLGVIGEHQVLTAGQLVRLTGMLERTVQHRLGVLYRAGLVSRYRPHAAFGTSPYHCWLTTFGADPIGAGKPEPWSKDLAGLRTAAALTDLWLGLRDHGATAGLVLKGWHRLPSGVSYQDQRTGAERQFPADAELTVALSAGATEVRSIVSARIDRVPRARLATVLARFADYIAAASAARADLPVLAVLSRLAHHRAAILGAAEGSTAARTTPSLEPAPLMTTAARVAVGVIDPHPTALAAEAVWRRTATDEEEQRPVDVVAEIAGSNK